MNAPATAAATPLASPVAGPLRALLRTELLLLRRNGPAALLAVITPLVFGFLLARGFGDDDLNGVAGIVGSTAMAAVFSVHYHLTAVFATRRQDGVLQQLRAGVLTDRTILLGTTLGSLTVFATQALVLIGFGVLVLGLPLPAQPLTMLIGLAGMAAVLAALAVALSGVTRSAEAALLTTLPTITLMLATPGVIIPAAHVGPVPHAIGMITPVGAATALLRDGWTGTGLFDALPAIGVLCAWFLAAALLGRRLMRWAPRRG